MFHEGDLQGGIAKAMQENKLVACFVTDDGEESQLWESDFLQEGSVKSALATQTVLLRLVAGSQEAGYLAAIFPLPKTPTLVLLRNGKLKEYLAAGVPKEDFLKRLGAVLNINSSTQNSTAQAGPSTPSTNTRPQNPAPTTTTSSTTASIASSSQPPTAPPSRIQQQTDNIQAALAERSVRLEAQKKEQDAKEKAKRQAEAKARKEAMESAPPGKSSADMNYAQQQKKRQQEARDERTRILKRVEDDKAERREREIKRKAEAKAKLDGEIPLTGSSSAKPPMSRNSAECALQIRLFDGSTIRSRFPSSGNLLKDVRPWIDEKQEDDIPYTFKQVLTPLPNKNIETSEEERSLQSLGLTPSATLILLPVAGAISAYAGNSNVVSRSVSAGYGLVSSSVGIVTGALGTFLGVGAAPAPAAPESQPQRNSAPGQPSVAINAGTLRDREPKKDKQQFYNGNSTNFEPRKDEDTGKDD